MAPAGGLRQNIETAPEPSASETLAHPTGSPLAMRLQPSILSLVTIVGQGTTADRCVAIPAEIRACGWLTAIRQSDNEEPFGAPAVDSSHARLMGGVGKASVSQNPIENPYACSACSQSGVSSDPTAE